MNPEKQSSSQSNGSKFQINFKSFTWKLWIIAIILALVSFCVQYFKFFDNSPIANGLIPVVDVDTELSIPSVYSFVLLFIATVLLMVITIFVKRQKGSHLAQWVILTFGFLYMTFDEGSSIHELLMEPMGRLMGNDHPRIFYFTWLVPACIAVALIGLLFIKFLIDLPAKARWGFLLAAVVYLGGAMGFEMISGDLASYIGIHNFDFDVLSTIEETLEMSGAILFIYALLSYISDHYRSILFKLNP